MKKMGVYIYGIVNSAADLQFANPGDSASDAGGVLPKTPGKSKFGRGVHTVSYQDISALVSASEIVDYTHMRTEILARLLVCHQTVIERVLNSHAAVIPMKLGTFAQDEAEVRDILSKGYGITKEIFQRISDKVEIDVVARWNDFSSVIKEAGEDREIKEYKEKLLTNPKGITVDDQMKMGFMVGKALNGKKELVAGKILDDLKLFSVDIKTHELMNDEMVINIAFLIDKEKRESFDQKVETLNAEFGDKLNFRCVGPLPPYSFFTLEVKKMQFEEIDWAKKRLGISNDVSNRDELKKAYQKQAFSTHPDKNPGESCAVAEFNEVNKAYKIISTYCIALEQEHQDQIPLCREMFKENTMLIRVRE
ncbi:MAG: GvpL/GvpF family gas vesicle protein [Candidatus Wallbacteria bacterium]|nr:GvpL/GvpF family gas vesicle protein [Candidatus Wallbacteria bacterium]